MFTSSYVPEGFLQMIYIDTNGLDRQHYQFDYVRREFLGEVRCVVFDVTPLPKSGRGRFKGRIWAEDQNFTIVRFNGVYTPIAGINSFNLHFDSWRTQRSAGPLAARLRVQPGIGPERFSGRQHPLQVPDAPLGLRPEERRTLSRSSPKSPSKTPTFKTSPALPRTNRRSKPSVNGSMQAEINVLDRLQRTGLLAPPGEVDKVMETVINNLEVTNNLDIQPEVHCRVLLTGTIEMFTIGHTIVLSRGLLDALPDEASLAAMLAQELANIIVTKPSTDQWGFNDTTNVSTTEALSHFSFKDTPAEIQLANAKALELLKNSPYKDKLGSAGLFLKQLDAESKTLPSLINPRLGNRVQFGEQLAATSPNLDPNKLDQISALPIGARIKVDPWGDHVGLVKAKPVPLLSAREKMPFEVTPFMPFLTRYQSPSEAAQKADVAKQQNTQPQAPQQQ